MIPKQWKPKPTKNKKFKRKPRRKAQARLLVFSKQHRFVIAGSSFHFHLKTSRERQTGTKAKGGRADRRGKRSIGETEVLPQRSESRKDDARSCLWLKLLGDKQTSESWHARGRRQRRQRRKRVTKEKRGGYLRWRKTSSRYFPRKDLGFLKKTLKKGREIFNIWKRSQRGELGFSVERA